MATSGTYTDSQSNENIVLEAYERVGYDVQKLNAGHAATARRSMSFMFTDWDNRGPKQWTIEQQSFTCQVGTADYSLAVGTLDVLEVVLRDANDVDTPVNIISRSEYVQLNNKTIQGSIPDRAYIQRGRDGVTMTLYQVPSDSTKRIVYWRIRYLQDVGDAGHDPDAPRRWWDAIASGLARRLHQKIPRDLRGENWINEGIELRNQERDSLYNAQTEDRERADLGVYPANYYNGQE
jgi:hypothetical protein